MQLFYDLAYIEKPVQTGVNGAATGGELSIVLASDIVIASDRTKFGALFTTPIRLVPDTGTTYFLPRVVALPKAREMIIKGDLIEADETHRIGLVSKIMQELEKRIGQAGPKTV